MKYIDKTTPEPDRFIRWKKRNKRAGWNDFSGGSEYREVKEQLIGEQLWMCCYCEVILSLNDCHVEHLKPKSVYPQNMFAYENLLASCNRKKSCGGKKNNWYDSNMVSPLNEDCQQRFTYTHEGMIIPSDEKDTLALETIEQLGLNCFKLKNQRKSIITAVENVENDPDLVDLLQSSAAGILQKKKDWPFGFYTVLLYLAEEYKIPIPQ